MNWRPRFSWVILTYLASWLILTIRACQDGPDHIGGWFRADFTLTGLAGFLIITGLLKGWIR